MKIPLPLTRDLVLIGGGHAHALALLKWGMNPLPGARLTLINPGPTAPYSGMLPGAIAGHYGREDLDIDLVQLARFAGARLIVAPATGIDADAGVVSIRGRSRVAYDVASIDVGIHTELPDIPGFSEHATGAKPLDLYASRWRGFLAEVKAGARCARVAVIGGGVAGVELALAMSHALASMTNDASVTVIEAADTLTGTGVSARRHLLRALERAGVTIMRGAAISRISAGEIAFADGSSLAADFVVGAAGATPHGWIASSNLPLRNGFIRVKPDLGVEGFDNLFAVGDCAHMAHAPRPKAGVFAVRAAPVLSDNLRAVLSGGRTRDFRPQRTYLKLISLGGKSALAEKAGLAVSGPLLWRWKDRIDRKFMAKFRDLPEMAPPDLPREVALGLGDEPNALEKPLCGGCGSKVGSDTLAGALAILPASGRKDILSGPGDDAAILAMGGVKQVITTDHLRALTDDPGLLARITAVHALGDIWAMGAMPQAALAAIILPRMSASLQARTMREIMEAAAAVFAPLGVGIVGGHSTLGAEMTIGFTLTGTCKDAPIGHKGARVGDALILTRPIGTGTILAAEMRGKADGRHVAAMFAEMVRPQDRAAAILAAEAHAMTDVTGFGLAGHLMSICRASATGAVIDLLSLPLYAGAEMLAAAGHRSSIYVENRAAAPVWGADGPRGALLHDPQTAGGLLAAVARGDAARLVTQLSQAGFRAAVIGEIIEGPVRLVSLDAG